MRDIVKAYVGALIHDGDTLHDDHALVALRAGGFEILPRAALPDGCPVDKLDGGVICAGFVDLQVNGGGGVMLGDDPIVETLRIMAKAHVADGTAGFLPTLITDTPARTQAAIDAVERAIADGGLGIAGLHLEGPHLSVARKGAHDAALIRPMTNDDLTVLLKAADRIANLMVTVAPENTSNAQISALCDAGITVSLGHTDADFETCMAAFDAGARAVTHLFNAMSQMAPRAPGLVGAALTRGDIYAGLIADGVHVHPDMIRVALAAKPDPKRIFLVSDAMAVAGTNAASFKLGGREIRRDKGRLTLSDGTLAGADVTMARAVSVMMQSVGDDCETAIARATGTPTEILRDPMGLGRLSGGARMAVHLPASGGTARVMD